MSVFAVNEYTCFESSDKAVHLNYRNYRYRIKFMSRGGCDERGQNLV